MTSQRRALDRQDCQWNCKEILGLRISKGYCCMWLQQSGNDFLGVEFLQTKSWFLTGISKDNFRMITRIVNFNIVDRNVVFRATNNIVFLLSSDSMEIVVKNSYNCE
jgi:hypothetical protein